MFFFIALIIIKFSNSLILPNFLKNKSNKNNINNKMNVNLILFIHIQCLKLKDNHKTIQQICEENNL